MVHKYTIKDDQGHGVSYVARRMLDEVIRLRNQYFMKNEFLFDRIYVSPTIANFFSDLGGFSAYPISSYLDSTTQFIGMVSDIKVFVDLEVNRNQIILSIGKTQIREVKINSIISDMEVKKTEVTLEIESDLI